MLGSADGGITIKNENAALREAMMSLGKGLNICEHGMSFVRARICACVRVRVCMYVCVRVYLYLFLCWFVVILF